MPRKFNAIQLLAKAYWVLTPSGWVVALSAVSLTFALASALLELSIRFRRTQT